MQIYDSRIEDIEDLQSSSCNKALDFAPPFVCHLAEQHVFACRVVFSGYWELICTFFVCC